MIAIERSTLFKHEEKKKKTSELKDLLQTVMKEECRSPGFFAVEIISIKKRLEVLDTEQYKGAVVRARWKGLSLGEIPTKRAIGEEWRYASKNDISEITYRGVLSGDKDFIERAFVEYFKELFSYRAPKKKEFRIVYLPFMPRLAEDIKEKLELPISLAEVERAIDHLKPGKSPVLMVWALIFIKRSRTSLPPFCMMCFPKRIV